MKNAEHAEHNIFQTETVAVNEGEKGNLVMGIKTYSTCVIFKPDLPYAFKLGLGFHGLH